MTSTARSIPQEPATKRPPQSGHAARALSFVQAVMVFCRQCGQRKNPLGDAFGAAGKKSNDVVAHLQQHGVPRYWARTLTTRYLKQREA